MTPTILVLLLVVAGVAGVAGYALGRGTAGQAAVDAEAVEGVAARTSCSTRRASRSGSARRGTSAAHWFHELIGDRYQAYMTDDRQRSDGWQQMLDIHIARPRPRRRSRWSARRPRRSTSGPWCWGARATSSSYSIDDGLNAYQPSTNGIITGNNG
jgi:hypothetical protein